MLMNYDAFCQSAGHFFSDGPRYIRWDYLVFLLIFMEWYLLNYYIW